MGYIGKIPSAVPLTSADITDGIITSAKIADGTIANADINSSAAIAYSKLSLANSIAIADFSATGTPSSTTFLRGDNTWGSAGAAAGQVIQVVSATDSTQRTTTSSTFTAASNTLSVAITPSATANKILILVSSAVRAGTDGDSHYTVFRGTTDLGATNNKGFIYTTENTGTQVYIGLGINYLDSPSTTSSTTYEVRFRTTAGTAYLNANSSKGSITLLEIKG